MASKMKSDKDLNDQLISRIIHAEDPLPVPEDLLGSIMMKIEKSPEKQPLRAYQPPLWLRWGIPGIFVISFLLILLTGRKTEPLSLTLPDFDWIKEILDKTDTWFTGLFKTSEIPEISLPDHAILIISAGIVLLWGFILLNRFLERRVFP